MIRTTLTALLFLLLSIPVLSSAADNLAILESVVAANDQIQPGLHNYHATVETSRIEEMMMRLTKGMPADVTPPPAPVIKKFWQRHGDGLVYASSTPQSPYVEKMVNQVSANLAIELNEMLLPAKHAERRQVLAGQAKIKASEVALADKLIHHLEITFDAPTDLDEAFYVTGMRLPQKQINSLTFDIDTAMNTISEMRVMTADGLHLAVELRYIKVVGGYIPERFRVTSLDGKIDDLFEVKFTEVDGYILPSSMRRTIRRPELQEDLEVFFTDYQVNRPIDEDLQSRLKAK